MEAIIEIAEAIKELVNDRAFQERHKAEAKSFSRKKKLDFRAVFFFVVSMVKQSLEFDVERFFGAIGVDVWPSAITQRRAQLKWTAFEEVLENVAERVPRNRTLKGYNVVAFDGLHGELPRQPELIEEYGLVGGSSYPQFQAVAAFDVLNEYYLCASWGKYPTDERKAAIKLIETKRIAENALFLFDRGFPGIELIKCVSDNSHKFLMRVSSSTFKEVMSFAKSGRREGMVTIRYDKKRAKRNKHKSIEIELPYCCTLRCVRVDLPSGETEILLTNMTCEEWSAGEIGELYFLRWGIETNINHLKNAIHIETFIGVKDNSIRQEFYASLMKYNLVRLAISLAQEEYDSKKTGLEA